VWFLLQSLIVFAVMASNIFWHWTENVYLAAMIGIVAALLATVAFAKIFKRVLSFRR